MKTRRILYVSSAALILFVLLILSKLLYPPSPIARRLSDILPDSPIVYLHCSKLQTHLKDFIQHEQYQRLLQTPRFRAMLQTEKGQAQLETFQGFLEDRLLSPMQLIGKELAFALYRSPASSKAQPAAILLSRVSEKAKLAERVFYAFDWLTDIAVEKLPLALRNHTVYQVQQKDLLIPIYYILISDLAVVSSSLDLIEDVVTRISEEKPGQKAGLFDTLARGPQPESRVMTVFAEPSSLAEEFSSTPFFRSWYIMNQQSVEQMKDTPPLFGSVDSLQESVRLHIELAPAPKAQLVSQHHSVLNSCWNDNAEIRGFPLLLDISPVPLEAVVKKLQELFPQMQQNSQNLLLEYRLWESAIECRMSEKPVGKLYALPDLLCASDSPRNPEESAATVETIVNGIVEERVPPMLRNTMLRQERTRYQNIPLHTLHVMFQEVFSYAAPAKRAAKTFNILATNSDAVRQGIDRIRDDAQATPFYCANIPPDPDETQRILPAAGLWIHADRLARFLEDFSKTKSFELLVPRKTNPEFYAQLPDVLLTLRSLPPLYLEIGLQEQTPTLKLWSKGYEP